jgi:serine/threonine protein kinase
MGVAWLCRDLARSGQEVVVKHAWNFAAPLALCDQAIRDEADVLASLDHPAIVRLLDRFELDGRFHLVREFLDGPSLGKAASGTGLAAPRRRIAARRVAEAVGHVHARGFLFLDVQPDNFFLLAGDVVKAGDTGLCRRLVQGQVALPRPVGARGFIAPELMQARPVATVRSDVAGFGRLYYALMAGRRPSQRADAAAMAAQLREGGAPADEVAFVARCCADDPAARPQDMGEVARLLGQLAPA